MFDNTYALGMASGNVIVTRVNQDNFGSTYFGVDGSNKIELVISHDIPKKRGASGESHLCRLNVEHYDEGGTYLRTSSAWTVIKTFDNAQNETDSAEAANALAGFLSAARITKLVARES